MLENHSRPPMKRTSSMRGMITTTTIPDSENPISLLDPQNPSVIVTRDDHAQYSLLSSSLSPKYYNNSTRRNSCTDSHLQNENQNQNQNQTFLPFLSSCGLCNRRLSHGHDIYMYRGDTAFCSQECRDQQINFDERKDKRSSATKKNFDSHRNHPERAATSAVSDSSGKEEPVSAA